MSPPPPFSLTHEVLLVATICLAQLLTQAGLGQALGPLRYIGEHFGTTKPGQLSWYVAAYGLTIGTFILIAGRLGDMYGHKRLFIFGFLWYGAWSVLAGGSYYSTDIFFNICRGMQGIGPAFLLPNGLALLGRTYAEGPRKNLVFSLFGACAPGGFVLGAVFAGLFAQLAWWAWAYWTMGMVCVLVAGLAWAILPDPTEQGPDRVPKHFDFLGAVVGVAGLVLINVAWNQGPSVGWGTPYVYILLILGAVVMAAFIWIEARVAQPLVPITAFSGETGFVLACVAAGWSTFGIWIFYVMQFLEQLRHDPPMLAAAQLSPVSVSGAVAALTTGWLMTRMPTAIIMTLAQMAFCIGTILVATMPVEQSYWAQTFVAILVIPWGMDMSFPAATLILSGSVGREHQGIAASLVATVVNYSISIGLGVAGTVASQVDPQGQDPLRAYRAALYTGIGISGVGILISLAGAYHQHRHAKSESKAGQMMAVNDSNL
ncbi:MAG: hypothetical protein M1838_003467 [Thelocarpon superellum]|nr:MAG: hypothetical protein M1838_003467 [Thelocarpon superellum]